jgi:hypothetical protein
MAAAAAGAMSLLIAKLVTCWPEVLELGGLLALLEADATAVVARMATAGPSKPSPPPPPAAASALASRFAATVLVPGLARLAWDSASTPSTSSSSSLEEARELEAERLLVSRKDGMILYFCAALAALAALAAFGLPVAAKHQGVS